MDCRSTLHLCACFLLWLVAGLTFGCDSETDASPDEPAPPPTVSATARWSVTTSTHVYAQGQRHAAVGGEVTETRDLHLDLYRPDAPGLRPLVVLIHGGGFVVGNRNQTAIVEFAEFFAARGWVAAAIDYRLAPDNGTVPEAWLRYLEDDVPARQRLLAGALYPATRDAKAAVRWLRAHAAEYAIDPDRVAAIGASAGSFLAIALGVVDEPDFRDEMTTDADPTLAGTHLDQSSRVHTVINHWGGVAILDALEGVDGVSRFDAEDAPVSIVHGTADPTVAFAEAERVRDAYAAAGAPFAFHPLEGAEHGAWDARVDGVDLPTLAWQFIVEQQGLEVGN